MKLNKKGKSDLISTTDPKMCKMFSLTQCIQHFSSSQNVKLKMLDTLIARFLNFPALKTERIEKERKPGVKLNVLRGLLQNLRH